MPVSKKTEEKSLLKRFLTKVGTIFAYAACTFLVLATLSFVASPLFEKNDIVNASVMITNVAANHGGSGVILDSNETESRILTNSHVCRVVEKGGLVSGRAGTFLVTSYKHSETHDICLITVAGNMKAETKVAELAPQAYYENASISGHPALMPNVVTKGHFSGRKVIEVMTGVRKCTEEDLQDPGKLLLCALAGGIPEVKRYESILVSATIMPGSSGSAVYNSARELSGLAFAGSGNLGYAWTVPFEAVRNFLDKEQRTLERKKPENSVDVFGEDGAKKDFDETVVIKKLRDACESPENRNKFQQVCGLVAMDMLYLK